MNTVEKRMITVKALMQEHVPVGETIKVVAVATYRKPTWMEFLPSSIYFEFGDYNRVFDIGLTDATIVIVGYKRPTINYSPKKIWTIPVVDCQLERAWMTEHLHIRDETGKDIVLRLYGTGVNKQAIPIIKTLIQK